MDTINLINQKLKYSVNSNNRDVIVAVCINSLNKLLKTSTDEEEIFVIKHILCELSKQLNTGIPFKKEEMKMRKFKIDAFKRNDGFRLLP